MKKLKNVKRILGIILTGLIGLNTIGFTAVADETDPNLFTVNGGTITGFTGDETNIVLPTEINGTIMTDIGSNAFKDNYLLQTIVIPEGYVSSWGYIFKGCISLKKVLFPLSFTTMQQNDFRDCTALEAVNIPPQVTTIPNRCFQGCSNPNLIIDIQSVKINSIGSSNVFTNVTGTIKTYSQSVYDLVKANATTANVVLIEDNTTALKEALGSAAAYKEDFYTVDSFKVLTDAVNAGNTVIDNGNASQSEIDNAIEAINNAIDGLVKRDFIEFDKIMAEAEDILNNHFYEYTSYTAGSLKNAVNNAKTYKDGFTGEITEAVQNTINEHTNKMYGWILALIPVDKTELFNELQQAITTAESYGSKDFTEESYAELEKALTEAKSLTSDSSFEQLTLAKQAIETAVSGLEIKPGIEEKAGEPFAIIQKNAVETNLGTFTADESLTGTTKIKLTFDCASDVSFNQYASIEVKAMVNGTESYLKFMGTDLTETAGAKGFSIELPLTNPIASGDEISLVAYTWAWANASDYVYGITKIEYMNSVGQILKAVTDRTIALDELKAAITEAEKIEAADYTEDSFEELTAALTAAKELPDDSEKADIESAKTAIETAVAGLVEKTDNSSSEPDSEPDSESTPDSESSSDIDSTADSSSKTEEESSSKTDNSSSKTDDSNNSTSSKTDSASSNSKANTANSGTAKSSNPNTGAKATAAGIILLSAIGVIVSRKK